MSDYSGSTVYLGIDVHKRTYSVTAIHQERVVKRDTFLADPALLIAYCWKQFPGAVVVSAHEAGFCGFHLYRLLAKAGIINHVINPSSVETKARERAKTDKIDSLKLAKQLSQGRIRGIFVPTLEQELRREVTRIREAIR